ncbi:MFS general substrate transporter [Neoconidiobolus thromboides FSU 785]|nr:MFS general substrate transporter [Neoconidiobolus thromboides FSU 785]
MSIGSHFAAHTLAPIKDNLKRELNITNTQFGLLQSSLLLFQTVTPIVGGILSDELGTELTSFYATLAIFIGELLMAIAATFMPRSIQFFVLGLGQCLFGLGAGGIVTIQETILVNTFLAENLSLAMGSLFAIGKLSGFLASGLVAHLVEWFNFYGSIFWFTTILTFISFSLSIIYMKLSKAQDKIHPFIPLNADIQVPEEYELTNNEDIIQVKKVNFKQRLLLVYDTILNFDFITWYYVVVLTLSFGSIWTPFLHLASNLILHTFDTTQVAAGWQASISLGLPIILCPLFGFLVDRFNKPQPQFIISASVCLLVCFLILDSSIINSPIPSIVLFAISLGCGPLSLATIAPDLLLLKGKHDFKVGTLLGLHRAVDHMGSSLLDTLLGYAQDHTQDKAKDYGIVLGIFKYLTVANLVASVVFYLLVRKKIEVKIFKKEWNIIFGC